MNYRKKVKKELGERYVYKKYMSTSEIKKKLSGSIGYEERLVATVVAGCVKVNAVICFRNKEPHTLIDILVKDVPTSTDWTCFDSLIDVLKLPSINLENDMFSIMNREVREHNLSYTECNYQQIEGKLLTKS